MSVAKAFLIRGLLFISITWAARIGWYLHEEVRARQEKRPDIYPRYSDLKLTLGFFVVLLMVQRICRLLLSPVVYAMIPKKGRWSKEVYRAKVTRCCDSIFKGIYYVGMTAWGFSLLRGQPYTPWVLGGSGETRFCWADGYPYQPVPPDLQWFYLLHLGFHLLEVAMLLFEDKHPDFGEMFLHHVVACCLLFFSYMLNLLRIGSLVLSLHGATDIFIYASKVFVDTPWSKLTGVSFIGLILAYAWFRVIVFPCYVLRSAYSESLREVAHDNLYGWGFLNFCLVALLLLHMYWFGLIIKMGLIYRESGQARDIVANLSSLDVRKEKKVA